MSPERVTKFSRSPSTSIRMAPGEGGAPGTQSPQANGSFPTSMPSRRNSLLIIGALLTGLLFSALDQTIVATAGPTIISDLGGRRSDDSPEPSPRGPRPPAQGRIRELHNPAPLGQLWHGGWLPSPRACSSRGRVSSSSRRAPSWRAPKTKGRKACSRPCPR